MSGWDLPTVAEINGRQYNIHADYRDVLAILDCIQAEEETAQAVLSSIAIFYEEFEDMPGTDYISAWDYLKDFINCGEAEDNTPTPKLLNWEQDRNMIAAEINKVACTEVRALPFMHWYTFVGYFHSIGEGQLSTIVGIRNKKAKGRKLEKWEQEFYQANKKKVDIKVRYTAEEQAEQAKLLALLGE